MSQEGPRGSGEVKWVSCEWLAQRIGDESFVLIDTQPDVHDYIVRHIPGAIYMNEKLLRVTDKNLPTGYVPAEVMSILMRRVGIVSDKPVVVYTDRGAFSKAGDGLEQTMMAYSLIRFGHTRVYLLNGGLHEWKKEKNPLSKKFPFPENSSFNAHERKDLYVSYDRFKTIMDDDEVIIVDVRPKELYEGQAMWEKSGHIPGAVNLPWPRLMDAHNSTLVADDNQLEAIIKELNLNKDKTIIFYCGTGREATAAFCVFRWYLGYPRVLLFEGSFTQWNLYPDNPTVTGPNPR